MPGRRANGGETMARSWLAGIIILVLILSSFIPTAGKALAAPRAADPPGWYALPNGGLNVAVPNGVYALAEYQGSLYVGGSFTQTFDGAVTNLNNIASYDGSAWHALPHQGLRHAAGGSDVRAMIVYNGSLYVGGTFTQTFDNAVTNLNYIARYDGTTWQALPKNGLNALVLAFAIYGGDLYVAGGFDQTADGTLLNLGNIVRFDGAAWHALPNQGLNCGGGCPGPFAPSVGALQTYGGDLYVGGAFSQTADGVVMNLNNITRYDGATWHTLANNGLNNSVYGFGVYAGDLYVGGNYLKTADTTKDLFFLSRYDGSAWYALPNESVDSAAVAFFAVGSDLYTGGSFTDSADGLVDDLNQIARFDGSAWHPLPNKGLAGGNRVVRTLLKFGDDLFVGGDFTRTFASITLNYIGRLVLPVPVPSKVRRNPRELRSLPSTGFAPRVQTEVGFQPPGKAYTDLGELWLEIPRLKLKRPIVGVPYDENTWDVSWLAGQVGYLEGTAFPTWAGNSVITGHVYDRSGLPGPFAKLETLAYDDQVIIHAWGQEYIYQVRSNRLVSPNDKSILKHQTYPWVTLLTCQGYNPTTDSYRMRRLVSAVLVRVTP
jgi:LPXTG-site transpeptidase (sortase) family protein